MKLLCITTKTALPKADIAAAPVVAHDEARVLYLLRRIKAGSVSRAESMILI
jgi:hypothetical protein